jgi:hypothetical protein
LAGVAALTVPFLMRATANKGTGSSPEHAALSTPTHRGVITVCQPEQQNGRLVSDFCDRLGADTLSRSALTAEDMATASRLGAAATAAIDLQRHDVCVQPSGQPSNGEASGPCMVMSVQMSVDEVSRALRQADFKDVIVRIAQDTDPAPAGSVLYSVPVGNACLVGYVSQQTRARVVGQLPGGTCLPE